MLSDWLKSVALHSQAILARPRLNMFYRLRILVQYCFTKLSVFFETGQSEYLSSFTTVRKTSSSIILIIYGR